MSEKALFMFGGGISLLVLSGVFFYAMASFRAWSERETAADSSAARAPKN